MEDWDFAPTPVPWGTVACLAGLVWGAVVLVVHLAGGALVCNPRTTENSSCAHSHAKNGIYQGVLGAGSSQGRARASTAFTVHFSSRRDAHRDVSGFTTDAQGGYCIVWAEERSTPVASYDDTVASIKADWRPLAGAKPPTGCQAGDRGIPWNRADDLRHTPQYVAGLILTLAGMALLLLALVLRNAPSAWWLRTAGLSVTAASTLLVALLWLV